MEIQRGNEIFFEAMNLPILKLGDTPISSPLTSLKTGEYYYPCDIDISNFKKSLDKGEHNVQSDTNL
jgi:hypothetical protein